MSKADAPELRRLMNKQILVQINSGRKIKGTLIGFDPFMNLVVDGAVEVKIRGVGLNPNKMGAVMVRGNSIITVEVMDRI
jgi:small nuclear ribonucleoprotein G